MLTVSHPGTRPSKGTMPVGVASRAPTPPRVTVDGTIDEGEAFMSSRPNRQERIQRDLDELLRQSATLAKALLVRNGEFFPFGATIGTRGAFSLVTPLPEGNRPTAQDVIEAILNDIRSSNGSLRASSVTALASTESGADAVRIELEHLEGSSLVISLPYTREESGAFSYGEMEAHRVERRIWPDSKPKARSRPTTQDSNKTKTTKRTGTRNASKSPLKPVPKASARGKSQARPTPSRPNVARKSPRKSEVGKEDSSPHRSSDSVQGKPHAEAVRMG